CTRGCWGGAWREARMAEGGSQVLVGAAPDGGAIRWWHALTTVGAEAVAARDPVLVLPLSATEQHGPHLPLSTDQDIGLGLLDEAFRRLPENVPAWALPPIALGCSREHARFAGTLSLEPEQLAALI